jgi:hypothetical protein
LVTLASAEAAFVFFAQLVFAAAPLGFLVAEPGGDLVACAFEETALLATAITTFKALVTPTRTFSTRSIPRVVTVICHVDPPNRNKAGSGTGRKPG